MDNTPTTGDEQGGLDRRSVLRRGAILGGALVWTVPAVQTLAGPAFAAGSSCAPTFTVSGFPGIPNSSITFVGEKECCDCLAAKEPMYYNFVKSVFGTGFPDAVYHQVAGLLAAIECSTTSGCKPKVN